jgi:hypothetical protein
MIAAIAAFVLGTASALAAAPVTQLPDPTRPYAYAPAIQIDQSRDAAVQWRLNGVQIRDGQRSAILNGRVVKPGDSMEGVTVIEINPTEVVLSRDTQRIVVKLLLSGVKKAAAEVPAAEPASAE